MIESESAMSPLDENGLPRSGAASGPAAMYPSTPAVEEAVAAIVRKEAVQGKPAAFLRQRHQAPQQDARVAGARSPATTHHRPELGQIQHGDQMLFLRRCQNLNSPTHEFDPLASFRKVVACIVKRFSGQ